MLRSVALLHTSSKYTFSLLYIRIYIYIYIYMIESVDSISRDE